MLDQGDELHRAATLNNSAVEQHGRQLQKARVKAATEEASGTWSDLCESISTRRSHAELKRNIILHTVAVQKER